MRKWEWLTFILLVVGVGLTIEVILTLTDTMKAGQASWITRLAVVGQAIVAALSLFFGLGWTPLRVTIDDRGITWRRGTMTRVCAWSELDNLWIAKKGTAVALISTSAPAGPVHPWDRVQAKRLHVAPGAVIGCIRHDALAQVEAGVRRHGRRELPVVYQH